MKKKTLVSILAVASAPMAGYANANLDQIKTDATTDWTGPDLRQNRQVKRMMTDSVRSDLCHISHCKAVLFLYTW